jgi:hypothetical protein
MTRARAGHRKPHKGLKKGFKGPCYGLTEALVRPLMSTLGPQSSYTLPRTCWPLWFGKEVCVPGNGRQAQDFSKHPPGNRHASRLGAPLWAPRPPALQPRAPQTCFRHAYFRKALFRHAHFRHAFLGMPVFRIRGNKLLRGGWKINF